MFSIHDVKVDHQLMCLSSLDVTGDGSSEVVSVDQSKASILCDSQSEASILFKSQSEDSIISVRANQKLVFSLKANQSPVFSGELLLGRPDLHYQPGQAGGQVRFTILVLFRRRRLHGNSWFKDT